MIAAAMSHDEEGQESSRALPGRVGGVTPMVRPPCMLGARDMGMNSVSEEARA